ncbi:MAG: hypothetical protein L6271_04680 [Desulfobacteraceae bacterium]|nr:hypothetical protein [Desulfobacteraceae bacterium]
MVEYEKSGLTTAPLCCGKIKTLVPPYLQRLLINRDVKKIARGTYLSGLFSIPFFAITGLIGIVALALDPSVNPNLAMPFVIKQALSPLFQGIVIAAVISIVMSSADSFLNAAAICFSNDIVRPLRRQPIAPLTELRMARAITLWSLVCSLLFLPYPLKVCSES